MEEEIRKTHYLAFSVCEKGYSNKTEKYLGILKSESVNWKTADRIEAGFSLNKTRRSLTDTTHEAITFSEFQFTPVRCEKLFFLHFFNVFHVH